MIKGKTIVVGVSGGIAAYKAASLCSKLVQAGAEVRVIMTSSATQFITPLTFQTLTRHHVMVDTFEEADASVVSHIDLADAAELVVIAPATANVIGKLANGIADNMLSTTLLATMAPILIAPAMNVHMYAHPAVQHNIQTLRNRGVSFIEPGEGQLACGYVGKGRLAEPDELYGRIVEMLSDERPLKGKKLLVTVGGTIERIDPVRYITNDSSGKMGMAIAGEAAKMGAEVTVICANTSVGPPDGVSVVPVQSAQDMLHAVMDRFAEMDIVIKAAAVADFRPIDVSASKIKKNNENMTLVLEQTTDILKQIGKQKTKQFIVGFAAETDNLEQHAIQKLRSKHCDLLVANDITKTDAGFGTDTNIVQIYDDQGLVQSLPLMSKVAIAKHLLQIVTDRMSVSRSET